jgi:4-amino-4-deoxy-L-arabinose transferase-like glycosyltransferase
MPLSIAGTIAIPCMWIYVQIYNAYPGYLTNFRHNANPDAVHYVVLGRNIMERGLFSRADGEPYPPDPLRTPVFPVVAAIAEKTAGGVRGIYLLNIAAQITTAVVASRCCSAWFGRKAGWVAGMIIALDPTLWVANFEAMTEPVFNLFAVPMALGFASALATRDSTPSLFSALWLGLLLGLAILTRPAAQYLPFALLFAAIAFAIVRRSLATVRFTLVALSVTTCLCLPWIARNYVVFGMPALSNIGGINYLYYSGGSAYALANETTLPEAQRAISREYHTVPTEICHNPWLADRTVNELAEEQRQAVADLWRRYPRYFFQAAALGIAKSAIANNVPTLARITGSTWTPPGISRLRAGDVSGFQTALRSNGTPLIIFGLCEMLFAGVVLVAAWGGVIAGLCRPSTRGLAMLLTMFIAYNYLTIAVVGMDAYERHRFALIPLYAAAFALLMSAVSRRSVNHLALRVNDNS